MTRLEEWKDIQGYEGYYQVSNKGNIRAMRRRIAVKNRGYRYYLGRVLVPGVHRGYYQVSLSKNDIRASKSIHQLVARGFLPNPLGHKQINHKNGIKTDNRVENIEWCTDKHNKHHAKIQGLKDDVGEQNPNAKLTDNQVIIILKSNDLKNTELANIFNVSPSMIGRIKNRKSWTHL